MSAEAIPRFRIGRGQLPPIPPGHKQTDIGVIPSDWNTRVLGDIGQCLIGLTYNPKNVASAGLLVLRSSNIGDSSLKFDDNVFVDMEIPERIIVREDDLLICVRNGSRPLIGKCALIDQRAVGVTFGAFMSVFRSSDNGFVFYCFQSSIVKRQIHEHLGATINQITNRSLNSFKIPYPESNERNAIAEALSDADGLLSALDALIAKKRAIKQATMQQLLTGKTRLPGFSAKWETKRIRDITKVPVTDGPHLTPKFLSDGIPFLSVNNLAHNRVDTADLRYISLDDHYEFSKKCKPQKWDILLGKAASVGRAAIVDFDWEFNIWSPIALIRPDEQVVPHFVYYCLQTLYVIRQIEYFTNSSSQGNIGMSDIGKLTLLLPLPEEQQAIATVLSDMDAEISALETHRAKTRAVKQGMMQQLLTGQIRLV